MNPSFYLMALLTCVLWSCGLTLVRAEETGFEMLENVCSQLIERIQALEKLVEIKKSKTQVAFSVTDPTSGDNDVALKYKTVLTKIGADYNPAAGIFTVDTPGLYYFTFFFHATNRDYGISTGLELHVNDGHKVKSIDQVAGADYGDSAGNAVILHLAKGALVKVVLKGDMCIKDEDSLNTFTGFLLQPSEFTTATKADIVFLVDDSGSHPLPFQRIRVFLHSIIEGLDIGPDKVHVGLAKYSYMPTQEFLLKDHTDKQSLLKLVLNLPYVGESTYTGRALTFLQTNYFTKVAGSRADEGVTQIVVVITDGKSHDDVAAPADLLRKAGVILFAIGVGPGFNEVQLKSIANRPHESFVFTVEWLALQSVTEGLLTLLKTV